MILHPEAYFHSRGRANAIRYILSLVCPSAFPTITNIHHTVPNITFIFIFIYIYFLLTFYTYFYFSDLSRGDLERISKLPELPKIKRSKKMSTEWREERSPKSELSMRRWKRTGNNILFSSRLRREWRWRSSLPLSYACARTRSSCGVDERKVCMCTGKLRVSHPWQRFKRCAIKRTGWTKTSKRNTKCQCLDRRD